MRAPGLWLLVAAALVAAPTGEAAVEGVPESEGGALGLLSRLESAWKARDLDSYLALWDPRSAAPEEERLWAQGQFAAEVSELRIQRPSSVPAGRDRLRVVVEAYSVREPRGKVEQLLLDLARGPEGWTIAGREAVSQIDGLLHLSLDPQGYRADGASIRLEDFELSFEQGTLFSSPPSLGPTALVFVGEGTVRFQPGPEAEREQLRQFAGKRELVERVRGAFIRIHPADFHRTLVPARLEPDPDGARRLASAQRLFRQQGSNAFVLDAPIPGSPWWLTPSLGDASVTFEAGSRGTLTLTISSSEAEGISLFDRGQRRQICLYPRRGGTTRYNEDAGRAVDVLHHDLRVRFDPSRQHLEGEDTLRLHPLSVGSATLRLRLADGLNVESVRSEAGSHLFFRVRGQDSLMVSLGTLAGSVDDYSLTIRYSGRLEPTVLDSELLQVVEPPGAFGSEIDATEIPLERVLVYTNRQPWHPQGPVDDYATARLRLEVPPGQVAISGGERTALREEGGWVVSEYLQRSPGRYIAVALGRLMELESRSAGGVTLRTYAVPRMRNAAAEALDAMEEILRLYAERFGPCPYPALSLVLTEARVPGGHSPPGMVILQNRPVLLRGTLEEDPANFRSVPGFFLAHEVAHQWWGHGIAGQNYRERWISEAGAQFAALLWTREVVGEDAFESVLRQMTRWAQRFNDWGPIHLGFRLGHIVRNPQIFRAVVYDKGAYVLLMLRSLLGEEAFFAGIRSLFADSAYRKIGTDDVRLALEAASGRELGSYFDAWIFDTRLPRIRYRLRKDPSSASSVTLELRAENLAGSVPLELTLHSSRGRQLERVTLPPEGGSYRFTVRAPVSRVEVNSDRLLLARVEKF
jgi:hypothetical protein